MRLLATRRVPDGAVLGRDVLTGRADAIPLLRAGAPVSARYRDALERAGVNAVYVEDPLGEGIEVPQVLTDAARREATRSVAQAFETARDAFAAGESLPPQALDELSRVAAMIAAEVESSGDVAFALADLSAADGYTHQHSVDVAALGLLLGHRLMRRHGWIDYRGARTYRGIDGRLVLLGLGLLVHDIGKLAIPTEILNKPGELDAAEWELVKTHPLAGLELLQSDAISPLVKIVVRSHHERFDGGGYPDGKAGEEINQLARIASVADVYDAVTSERVYAPARPAHVGVEVIVEGAGSAFDPMVVDVFRELVAPFPAGTEVELSDGRRGVVAALPAGMMERPVIRIAQDHGSAGAFVEVALADHPELRVVGAAPDD